MSDGDKRYDATPSRRERARREGNVAHSNELSSVAAFGAATTTAIIAVPACAAGALTSITTIAAHPLLDGAPAALGVAALAALAPAIAAAAGGSVVALAQGGGLHLVAVHVDAKRLDPIAGIKRMVGGEALVGVARGGLAFAAVVAALIPLGLDVVSIGTSLATPNAALRVVGGAATRACLTACAIGAFFALADYALAKRRWLRGLRMSLDELKRDMKENDGDPQARARRKSTHREIVRGAIGRTREASFIVVNPTHVAVALRYAPPAVPVPEILVRALDDAALQVRAIAREHGIPVVEDVALARLLYASGASGFAIPPETYIAVAQIVAELARAGLLA